MIRSTVYYYFSFLLPFVRHKKQQLSDRINDYSIHQLQGDDTYKTSPTMEEFRERPVDHFRLIETYYF